MGDTAEKVMKLQTQLINRIRNANDTQDFKFLSLLEQRLRFILSRIDRALDHKFCELLINSRAIHPLFINLYC